MLRDLILGILMSLALVFGLFSAPGSILALNWVWFQRPYDFSDGMWNVAPVFTVALAVAVASNLFHSQLRPRFSPLLVVYLALLCWVTISTIFAFDTVTAWAAYKRFLPSMWVVPIFLFATIHDLHLLRLILWVAAGSIGFNAFKSGVVLAAQGGAHLTVQTSGFVGDNNVFGLVLCLVVAILLGLRTTLPKKWWVKILFYIVIAFIILCIVFTKSRGAFLSVGLILVMGSFLSDSPLRNTLALLVVSAAAFLLVPSEYFERLDTVRDLSADESAMGRIENWNLAWETALANPMIGVGPENHMPYNLALAPNVRVRVAHSVYLQVLAEFGFPGLGLYLLFVGLALYTLFRTWRAMVPLAKTNPELVWVRDTAMWLTCGYSGYIFGSGLLNMFFIEFPWYAIFYGSMLQPLVNRELAKKSPLPIQFGKQN